MTEPRWTTPWCEYDTETNAFVDHVAVLDADGAMVCNRCGDDLTLLIRRWLTRDDDASAYEPELIREDLERGM